jgi:hypothetical protein
MIKTSNLLFPLLLMTAGAAVMAGCEVPTTTPRFHTSFLLPGETAHVSIGELLPEGVSLSADGQAFLVDLDPLIISQTLGEMCEECEMLNGQFVPKPAFEADLDSETGLPTEIATAELSGGVISLRIDNDLNFDPLRPADNVFGSVTITVSSAGRVLSEEVISGTDHALPAGGALTRELVLAAGRIEDPLSIVARVSSPRGDAVQMDSEDSLRIAGVPNNVRISEASVNLGERAFTVDSVELDLSDVGDDMKDRTLGGAVIVEIDNPLGVTGRLDLRIPGVGIEKSVGISPGVHRIEFSAAEMRSILGRTNVMELSGLVDAREGVRIRPADSIGIKTRIEIELEVGGSGN